MWQSWQDRSFSAVDHFARVTPALHEPLRLFAQYGVVLFAVLLLLAWWQARRSGDARRVMASLWAPVGALIAVGLNQPVSHGVHEARPYSVFPHALVLVSRTHDFSFPSDHAVMAGAVTVGVLLADRRLGIVAGVLALLMAFTRVYVGAHYPGDVVAGLLFGAAVSGLGYLLLRGIGVRLVDRATLTPLRPLLTAEPRA